MYTCMHYARPPNVLIVVWALWHGAYRRHYFVERYVPRRLNCLRATFNELPWWDLTGRDNALSEDIYISSWWASSLQSRLAKQICRLESLWVGWDTIKILPLSAGWALYQYTCPTDKHYIISDKSCFILNLPMSLPVRVRRRGRDGEKEWSLK